MSLAINIETVAEVLLADGWHKVHKKSFGLDSYEFSGEGGSIEQGVRQLSGGQEKLVPAIGAAWHESDGSTIFCPLTAVLAVRCTPKKSASH